jgi:hypothetical protein
MHISECSVCGLEFDYVTRCKTCGERFCADCGSANEKQCLYCLDDAEFEDEDFDDEEDWR